MNYELPAPYAPVDPHTEVVIAEVPAVCTAVVKHHDLPMSRLNGAAEKAAAQIPDALEEAGIALTGPAFALHHRWPVDTADVEIGFPIAQPLTEPIRLTDTIEIVGSELPGGRIATVTHVGPYSGLADAWGAFTAGVGEQGERMTFPYCDLYISLPSQKGGTARTDLVSLLEPKTT